MTESAVGPAAVVRRAVYPEAQRQRDDIEARALEKLRASRHARQLLVYNAA